MPPKRKNKAAKGGPVLPLKALRTFALSPIYPIMHWLRILY
jgi:hypothetical protein